MKLGVLSQWFDPEPGPASIPGVYAREFAERGHEVSVLTGYPNYPDGVVYPGYRIRRRATEQVGRLKVTRVALYPNHSSSAVGRAANYTSFAVSATLSGGKAIRGVDALWAYNSPATVSLPLLTHSRFGRVPVFLHVQDLWPESMMHSGMAPGGWAGRLATSLFTRIVRWTERASSVVGVISPGARDLILERHPDLDPAKVVYAPNPTNEALFRPADERRAQLPDRRRRDGPVRIMYAGSVGEVQGLDTLLDAAALLRGSADVLITIVGDGISRQRLEQRVAAERLHNVHFVGRVDQGRIPDYIADSDIQLVSLADSPFLAHTTPSKIASLLASGVPIIGHLSGDGAWLIEQAQVGPVVRPGNAAALAGAIESVASAGEDHWASLGSNGRAYYTSHLSAKATSDTILQSLGFAPHVGRTSPTAEAIADCQTKADR